LKISKLKKSSEFKFIFLKGRRSEGKYFNFIYLRNKFGVNRIAVIVKKEIGIAVHRNKIKRRIKEAFRKENLKTKSGYDIIIIVRKGSIHLSFYEVYDEISKFLHKERLIALSSSN